MLVFIDERDPVALVASAEDTVNRSTSYTFAGLNFGDDFTGRTLVVVVALFATGDQPLNQTSVTIGGSSASGGNNGDGGATGAGGTAGLGVWAARPSGTSGSVVVNFGGTATAAAIYLYATTATSATSFDNTTGITSETPDFPSGDSGPLDIPSGGLQIGGVGRANNTGTITMTGITGRDQITVDGVHRFAVGYDFRMAAETDRSVGFTTGSGSVIYAMRAASFNS